MAGFSGLDIYKLLPKTNCKECGFPTCLAFAMQLAKKAVSIDKCAYVSAETKAHLEAASLPPIRKVAIGVDEAKFEIGNETVMFRHEEKFRNPCAIGFIINDDEPQAQIKEKLTNINQLSYERVGQKIQVNAVAIAQTKDALRFVEAVKLVNSQSKQAIILMAKDAQALEQALTVIKDKNPLVYAITKDNLASFAPVVKKYGVSAVVSAPDLDGLAVLTQELAKSGIQDLVLEPLTPSLKDKIWNLTQIRRLALKKSNRSLGFPILTMVNAEDPYAEALEAATYILKYSGIVLMRNIQSWQTYALLTLRQNIYTDPQKPLQIEPKLYPIGQVDKKSPVLITTNFSLSYFTVLGEVEGSKVPSYILSVDTEGMSVLTAWAAEKFTPEKIAAALNQANVKDIASGGALVIPGYVAVISGDLEETSGCKVIVGPKEAAGIPAFLKNL